METTFRNKGKLGVTKNEYVLSLFMFACINSLVCFISVLSLFLIIIFITGCRFLLQEKSLMDCSFLIQFVLRMFLGIFDIKMIIFHSALQTLIYIRYILVTSNKSSVKDVSKLYGTQYQILC